MKNVKTCVRLKYNCPESKKFRIIYGLILVEEMDSLTFKTSRRIIEVSKKNVVVIEKTRKRFKECKPKKVKEKE